MKIIHEKMSLFDAPKGSVLVHACNAQGVWGSGIAAEFKRLFPRAYQQYNDFCLSHKLAGYVGVALLIPDRDYGVGCLFTSNDFGTNVDTPADILLSTRVALMNFFEMMPADEHIYSNRFNSGLFNVPWEDTEQVLASVGAKYDNITWTVCTP